MIIVTPIYYTSCPLQKVYVTTKDFGYYAFVVFAYFTPYTHIQVAHAFAISKVLPTALTLGRLKNEVAEHKHWEVENLHTAHGVG